MNIDRAEIRRRNLIPPDAFPYNYEIIYQDFAPLSYDSGNYEPILDKALELIGYKNFLAEEQPRLRAPLPEFELPSIVEKILRFIFSPPACEKVRNGDPDGPRPGERTDWPTSAWFSSLKVRHHFRTRE